MSGYLANKQLCVLKEISKTCFLEKFYCIHQFSMRSDPNIKHDEKAQTETWVRSMLDAALWCYEWSDGCLGVQ